MHRLNLCICGSFFYFLGKLLNNRNHKARVSHCLFFRKINFLPLIHNLNPIGINYTQRRKTEVYSKSDFPFPLSSCIVAGETH